MRTWALLFIIMLNGALVYAQSGADTLTPPVSPPNFYLKTNLFSLIEPDQAVTLSAEYRRNIRVAYQLEAGYIYMDNLQENTGTWLNTYGYRLKPEFRVYTPGNLLNAAHFVNYWAIEAIFKEVINELNGFVGRDCGTNGCAYNQQMTYHTTRRVMGAGGKIGWEIYIGRNTKRIIIDSYLGLGVRYRWKFNDQPADATIMESRGWFHFDLPSGLYPYLAAGAKIGVRVR